MPTVGLGTWAMRGDRAREAVRTALRLGYRHVDTATMYGNQRPIGQALAESGVAREELFVTTKLPPERAGREQRTLEESLSELGLEYLDLWLIHWPPGSRAAPDTWRRFQAARDADLVRSIGVSNYSLAQIDELTVATGETPAVNQIPYSPGDHDARLLAGHRERGVVVEGYSPLQRSNLAAPPVVAAARAHGVTPAQVVLRWHLQHDVVVIPKSVHPDRLAENLDLFRFTLGDDELAAVDGLARRR
jgi:diketogulonate reductase-like aldo/keto reductase